MATAASPAAADRLPHGASPALPAGALRAVVLPRAEAGSAAARRQWERLVAAAAEPNPFFEPWYLLPSLAALDPGGRVTLLVVERAGEWLGLLPLAPERRYYGHPLPHWRGWLHANAFVGLPLIARGHEAEVWTALLAHLDRTAGTGLFLHLAGLPLDSPACAALAAVCAAQGRQAALVHREERALLRSAASPADYLDAALSGKKRKELRRQYARLSEQGELAITRQRDAVGIDGWIAAFLALEQAGWKGRAGSALASHPATRALFEQALREAAAQGRLERLTLALDGAPIALLATFLAPPGAFSYKTAFDERYARFSPGVLLQRENLALLDDPQIAWCDSCAAEDHPMIDHLWRERRTIGRLSIAIGGRLRRGAFRLLARAEGGTTAPGLSLEGGMAPAGDPV